jgi:ATP-binding cassette subfamily B protein
LRDAPILLLDEATTRSTLKARRSSRGAGKLTANRTTLVIAHRLATVQCQLHSAARRRPAARGRTELIKKSPLYARLAASVHRPSAYSMRRLRDFASSVEPGSIG